MCFVVALLLLASTCDGGGRHEGPIDGNPPDDPEPTEPLPTEERPGVLNASSLKFSLSPGREEEQMLEGSTLQGSAAIFFVAPGAGSGITGVEFFLDDPTRKRSPMTRDTRAPFDFAGEEQDGQAILYDTRQLADGDHSVTVVVHYTRFHAEAATASFTVANASVPEPAPIPEPMPVPPAPPGLRTVGAWERLFRTAWEREHVTDFLPRSNSTDSWDFYGLAYGIDANTAMYRATGRTVYLDRALLYVNNLVDTARVSSSLPRSQFKDGFLGWASAQSDPAGQEVPLFESYCWRYVTRLLRVIRETPALYANPAYRSQYERLLAFTEKNIFEKWFRRGAEDFIYRSRTHMAAHWAFIAMDLMLMTEDASARRNYQAVFDDINLGLPNANASLRTQLEPHPRHPDAWFWSDRWGSRERPGQDVAHANGVLAFVIEAHDAGLTWTDDDLRRFAVTLDTVIWPREGTYAEYVDGSGKGDGWFNDGLMKLGRYDIALQRRLEQHRAGQNSQFYANGALNVRLLSAPRGP
ncbi:hypothetical protein [Myxococcus sp. RHSTA-1-4]|uniref:hypothetical protein n=1 Tax=Myxococcus sp. RHSTA-1-4 TaxID=2874601 RepID=UPI001CBCD473|nr:hypothetical protein [Myxococcus sp. RHSTA-1-4]MBZ4420835.1 hypothetical protein [Myxococcus sp. RHSTA-1-4]